MSALAPDVANIIAMICAGFFAALGGFIFGWLFFRTLAENARMYLEGGRMGRALILHAVRIAVAVALFYTAAQYGAGPLLAALLGFLGARAMCINEKKQPAGKEAEQNQEEGS